MFINEQENMIEKKMNCWFKQMIKKDILIWKRTGSWILLSLKINGLFHYKAIK